MMTTIRDTEQLPCDMQEEIAAAGPDAAGWQACRISGTMYLYFPECGRGGVCTGGLTEWSDCRSLDDLIDRWDAYLAGDESRWVN